MTIYIAVCDDNVADRKQTERLLEREKDARLKDNYDVLYIDSFGSEEALMHTPIKYDIFFIDITLEGNNGMDIAKSLRKRGITAPIVLCSSSVDYTSYVNAPKELIFLEKPLSKGQITHLIDVALDKAKHKTPLIELRGKTDTCFVPYTDIICAKEKSKYETEVLLADGSYSHMQGDIRSLMKICSPYKCFIYCKKDIVNILHIDKSENNGFWLTNGDFVSYTIFQKDDILNTIANYIKTLRAK